jgi:hypothetical protein
MFRLIIVAILMDILESSKRFILLASTIYLRMGIIIIIIIIISRIISGNFSSLF